MVTLIRLMKAVILNQPGQFLQAEQPDLPDKTQENSSTVRIHRVGICGTDLRVFEGVQTFFSYPRFLST